MICKSYLSLLWGRTLGKGLGTIKLIATENLGIQQTTLALYGKDVFPLPWLLQELCIRSFHPT